MTESEPIAVDPAEPDHPLIEEARLVQVQAEEAIQRIQQRIERLAYLAEAPHLLKSGDDG